MLNMTLDQYEFSTVDFGRPTNLKLYQEDKATLFTGNGYTGVIQGFKRRSDGSFYYWNDVTRGIAVSGFGAQVVANIDIIFNTQKVQSIIITNEGDNYTSPPAVTFTAAPVGGITATGTAVLTGAKVTSVILDNPGARYITTPTISFSGGSGSNAAATAVMDTGDNEGTFAFTTSNLANIPGYLWIKAVLSKGTTEVISSKFVRVFVDFGSPS